MRFLPIIDDLFTSDSGYFLVFGLVLALICGFSLKSSKSRIIGMCVSIVVYAVCEAVAVFSGGSFSIAFFVLVLGTAALGAFLGFLAALIVSKILHKK